MLSRRPVNQRTREQKALERYVWLGTPEGQAADRHWKKHRRQILERSVQSDKDRKLNHQRQLAASATGEGAT